MKSSSTKILKKTFSCRFKVGDLVMYTPYYNDADGPWVMSGDLGIVVKIVKVDESYQILRIRWADEGVDESDMACDVVKKINLNEI